MPLGLIGVHAPHAIIKTCALNTVWRGLAAIQFDWEVCG